jgi:hypothetical protein
LSIAEQQLDHLCSEGEREGRNLSLILENEVLFETKKPPR